MPFPSPASPATAGPQTQKPQRRASAAPSSCASYVPLSSPLPQLPSHPLLTPTLQPLTAPGLVDTFICNCTDCHKLTASMFASNFTVLDTHTTHLRGEANLAHWGQSDTIARGHTMTNFFCRTCGTLMYRVGAGFPGMKIARIGTVDDFRVMEGKLRPRREQFVKQRVGWLGGVEGTVKSEGMGE